MRRLPETRKAQHLVEFALVLPLLMMILLVIIEFGYAVVARSVLSEGTRMSLNRMSYLYMTPGDAAGKQTRISEELREDIDDYLLLNGIPFSGSVELSISKPGNNVAIVNSSYTYYPSFLLPNIFGGDIIPKQITMYSTQAINSGLLEPSVYMSYLNADDIAHFDSSTAISDVSKTYFVESR